MNLTDEQWQVVAPLIPSPSPAAGRGRPLIDERRVLDGILWKLSTDSPWSDLPPEYPSWQTCYRRYHRLQRLGLIDEICFALFKDLRLRGNLDIREAVSNGTILYTVHDRQVIFTIDPDLKGTWQYNVIIIYINLIIHRARKERRLTIRGRI